MHTIKQRTLPRYTLAAVSALVMAGSSWAQSAPGSSEIDEEDVIVLSPFEVSAEEEAGYQAATTLAGNRLNTELRDIGNAVTVITSQFLKDIAATDNTSLLQYTVGTEVGTIQGNFAGVGDSSFLDESAKFKSPNQNTRVRGLTSADNTRDYFLTDIPWDGYNVDRVDLQRGPNSILFGQGSPSGIINTGTKQAAFKNSNEVGVRVGSYGSTRINVDFNRVLLDDELAVRVAAVRDDTNYQQDPAFQDSERYYGAVRYEPSFLKQGSARTIIKANFEHGDVQSNNPRSLPPLDLITPWFDTGTYQGTWKVSGTDISTGQPVVAGQPRTFQSLNQETFNPHQLQDDNTGRVNHGQVRPGINGGPNAGQPNPWFNPWIGNYGQMFGGPSFAFSDGSQTSASDRRIWEIKETRGIGPSGAIDQGIGSWGFHRPGGIATQASFARAAGLEFSEFGVYKDNQLTDPSIYDFYNNLIDGPNKSEWQDWDAFNVSLAQTFMNDKFGFEVTHNEEFYNNGQLAFLSGNRQAINIDINNQFADSTPDGGLVVGGEPHVNGTPNPNVGRPFITDSGQFGNNSYESERNSTRATAFFTHDFNDERSDNIFKRILGSHTFTGLWAEDEQNTDGRNWQRYAIDDDNYFNFIGASPSTKFTDNNFAINRAIYLGPSLTGKSIEGANIPRPTAVAGVSSTTIHVFDSTWNAPGVDQAAYWANGYQLPGPDQDSTQSENWRNYVGWIDLPVNIVDSETSAQARQRLTTSARLTRSTVDSQAFVWQAKLLDNGLVGTYGYREDTAKSYGRSIDTNSASSDVRGHLDLSPSNYSLSDTPDNELDVTSRSYSIVAHLDQLPFIGKLTERLPLALSFYYNNSTNFQPAAQRVDAYGEPIAAPSGKTLDRGILLESRDGRYTLKVNQYKTSVLNASSGALNGAWFIGASQAWSAGWVNKYEFNLKGGYTLDRALIPNDPTDTEVNYGTAPGETLADAQAREAAAISAWRTYQASVDPRFYEAWKLDPYTTATTPTATNPQGFAVTEDSVSEGYEIEFSALPTRNWRLTLNASKTTAVRNNIGGEALAEFIGNYENALKNTAAGDLRIWWGGAGNETALFQWNNNVGSEWAARKLQEGTNVPELREWRFNAISNYDFTEGRLAGFSVGAALRWQDDVIIGYRPVPVPNDPTSISFDLANPYRGPTEMNVDAWIGYGKRLSDKIDWRVQLNVRNLGQGDGLIPITTQPDGTPAGYRIAPSQNWYLTNTFKF